MLLFQFTSNQSYSDKIIVSLTCTLNRASHHIEKVIEPKLYQVLPDHLHVHLLPPAEVALVTGYQGTVGSISHASYS